MKTIMDYFTDDIEYPNEITLNIMPFGELWSYISSTFLNGFVNYSKPIACYVVDRYTSPNEKIGDRNFTVCNKGEFGKWHKWEGTKIELIEAIKANQKQMGHTKLDCFGDDVILLGEISDGKYIFFWFDMDVSDCCIGRFETDDKKEDVILSVENWLKAQKDENADREFQENMDNGILEYYQLPISFLEGWISF